MNVEQFMECELAGEIEVLESLGENLLHCHFVHLDGTGPEL
jgi:hypothetical protein